MTVKPIISLDQVTCSFSIRQGRFRFKQFNAIKELSLTINKGETLGVIGRNGAGKSTLLKIIAGIIKINTGRITYHENVSVSLLTIQAGFSQILSGRENAILGAMLLGFTKKEAIRRLDRIIAFAELEDWIDQPLFTYSSGMRVRLGFSVAMEMNPDVLLVDEALGVGDEMFKKKSSKEMKRKMNSGITVIFVSHNRKALSELCSRTIWIDSGVNKMIGETPAVLDAYHNWSRKHIK